MKVENSSGLDHIKPAQANNTKPVEKDGLRSGDRAYVDGLSGKDEATLSERARTLAKARTNLADAPDVRTEIVDGLREQIQTGTYQISYETLAQRLLSIIKGG